MTLSQPGTCDGEMWRWGHGDMGDGTWEWELRVAIPGGSRLRGILGTSGRWVCAVLSAQCHCYGRFPSTREYILVTGRCRCRGWGCAVIADEAVLPSIALCGYMTLTGSRRTRDTHTDTDRDMGILMQVAQRGPGSLQLQGCVVSTYIRLQAQALDTVLIIATGWCGNGRWLFAAWR
ncbi:hypothetical protein K466DRAFT_6827 [Polyporus arcularius HHB13444]|uniref:Uncharacterized protein n=1 Tax=Polyporus arcularius HHB13444 TaxID=1314778 RepID=A0A5C3PLS3_9APHY|nr:hypothetical protein K466DRAFT_6827 [Polyporus arcularius HHB13444]